MNKTAITIKAIADTLEKMSGLLSEKDTIEFIRGVAARYEDDEPMLTYLEQLKFCSEHGMLCLEYYRRHGTGKRITVVQPAARDA